MRRPWTWLLLTAALLVVGLGVGQAFRDTTAPSLWIETPERVAAGERFELRLSADEPVVYTVSYGARTVERVEQDVVLELEALDGARTIAIEAVDGAGNATRDERVVDGVPVPVARWGAMRELRPGDPFTARLSFAPSDAEVRAVQVAIDGRPAVLQGDGEGGDDGGERWALGAVPLATAAGTLDVEALWRDGLDREGADRLAVPFGPLPQEVEELRLSPATLSVITPAGRELEAEALATATADPADPPRWREPFLLPIEGRGTSGFARPRRYAAGGPVSFHLGEDIAAPTGTPIRAANAGVVLLAGQYPIKGGLTVVDHGAGVTSRYYHQSRILVTAGDAVARGDVIGEVGSTGLSTGPHLHWEMRVDDQPTDPLAWVDRVRP